MKGIDITKKYSLRSTQLVKEICDPVLLPIGITYFNYIKIQNHDCSRTLLTNNGEWIEHFYKHALYHSVGAVDVEHLLPKGYFLWSEMNKKDEIYLQGRDFYNIDNGITFVIKRDDCTLLFIFASSPDNNKINQFYISQIDLLQRFIHFFCDKAHQLIQKAEKDRIYLPQSQKIDRSRVNKIILSDKTRNDFYEKTKISKYYLLNESDELYLTRKQAEYASLLIKGFTAKEIAKMKTVSHRTVEGHIQDIRKKLQITLNRTLTKEQILKILSTANLG
jgi:DNA-binding CsgD family transcriptional regulator